VIQTKFFQGLPISHESKSEWSEITPGERFSIRVSSQETDGAYTVLEIVADNRYGTLMHIHQNEDEHFIILEGTAHLAYGDKAAVARAGTSITVGKGIPHAWCNLADSPLRMLLLFTPGGIDELFRTTAKGGDSNIAALLDKFGTRMVGPALFDNIYTRDLPRSSSCIQDLTANFVQENPAGFRFGATVGAEISRKISQNLSPAGVTSPFVARAMPTDCISVVSVRGR
jgi:mannose-6-phosphate isomerase-like protein (cupin superfamily)